MTDRPTADFNRLRAVFETIPHCQAAGMRVEDLAAGRVRMVVDYRDDLVGNPDSGVLHGAVITSLIDSAGGLAAFSAMPDGTSVATLDLRIDYLRPATPKRAVFADTECYRATKNVAFVRGVAHHGDPADPIAHCAATFMLNSSGFDPSKKDGAS